MTLFIISIPLMILTVAAAVIPLIVMSHRDHLRHSAERAAAAQHASRRRQSAAASIDTPEADEALRASA